MCVCVCVCMQMHTCIHIQKRIHTCVHVVTKTEESSKESHTAHTHYNAGTHTEVENIWICTHTYCHCTMPIEDTCILRGAPAAEASDKNTWISNRAIAVAMALRFEITIAWNCIKHNFIHLCIQCMQYPYSYAQIHYTYKYYTYKYKCMHTYSIHLDHADT